MLPAHRQALSGGGGMRVLGQRSLKGIHDVWRSSLERLRGRARLASEAVLVSAMLSGNQAINAEPNQGMSLANIHTVRHKLHNPMLPTLHH